MRHVPALNVSTPEAFVKAVRDGEKDILITDHLDLTSQAPDARSNLPGYPDLLYPLESTRSIRVRCHVPHEESCWH